LFIKVGNEHASHTTSFDDAKQRIDSKYSEIEQHLLEEFVKSERSNDCQRMKDLALILSQFKVCYEITEFKIILVVKYAYECLIFFVGIRRLR